MLVQMALLAQVFRGSWSLGELLIAFIVVCACLGIVYVAVKQFQIPVPEWVWQILGIVIVAAVAILALRFVLSF